MSEPGGSTPRNVLRCAPGSRDGSTRPHWYYYSLQTPLAGGQTAQEVDFFETVCNGKARKERAPIRNSPQEMRGWFVKADKSTLDDLVASTLLMFLPKTAEATRKRMQE